MLFQKRVVRPLVGASRLTWFIYLLLKLQFLNNVIINKTKVLLPLLA